jgi:Trypsin
MNREVSNESGDRETEKERLALDWARLRFDRKKAAIEFRLRRQELARTRDKGWKELLANPFTLAIVGGFITVMSTIISNHFTASANVELERTKAELAAKAETAKAEQGAHAAKQTLQAELIKKFVESPKTQTVRENLKFLIDAGLLPDYAERISAYLKNNPDAAPQVGETFAPPAPVIGGTLSSSASWPWLVGIKLSGSPDTRIFCQGTVIGPHTVLTVAHCVAGSNGSPPPSIVAANTDGTKKEVRVAKVFVHPLFSMAPERRNDIAILDLRESLPPPYVTLSRAKATDPTPGTLVMVAAIASKDTSFLEAKIPIVDAKVCLASMGKDIDPASNLCAGFAAGGVDSCAGSGGGPLAAVDKAGHKYQIGISSWGVGCGKPNKYSVYTRVSAFTDWIKEVAPDLPTNTTVPSQP